MGEGGQRPWQRLYFLPLPQGHGALRPIFLRRPLRTVAGAWAATCSTGLLVNICRGRRLASSSAAAPLVPARWERQVKERPHNVVLHVVHE